MSKTCCCAFGNGLISIATILDLSKTKISEIKTFNKPSYVKTRDEYINYWCQDIIDQIEIAGILSGRQSTPNNSAVLIKNNQNFGGHIGENILSIDMTNANGINSFKYAGFYIPPRQSKTELAALIEEGYSYAKFSWCRECPTLNEQFFAAYCIPGVPTGYNSAVGTQNGFIWGGANGKTSDLSSWHTMYIPIENIIGCYEELVEGSKPLFFTSTEDNSPYTMNISEIKFVKEMA